MGPMGPKVQAKRGHNLQNLQTIPYEADIRTTNYVNVKQGMVLMQSEVLLPKCSKNWQ